MLNFLKKHWPELLVAIVIIALLGGLSPIIMPALAIITAVDALVYAIATVVMSGFGYAITNGIRTRNEPDFPWFDGITEGSTKSLTVEIASEGEGNQAIPLMDVTEKTPLVSKGVPVTNKEATSTHTLSLHERINSLNANLAADAQGVTVAFKPGF